MLNTVFVIFYPGFDAPVWLKPVNEKIHSKDFIPEKLWFAAVVFRIKIFTSNVSYEEKWCYSPIQIFLKEVTIMVVLLLCLLNSRLTSSWSPQFQPLQDESK